MPPKVYWETFFDPSRILNTLGLHHAEGPVVDVGTGYGTFALAAARLTRQQVFAIDIEPDLLEALASKALTDQLDNVKPMLRDVALEGTGLPDEIADIVLLFNILHCENPVALLEEAWRTLRPGGRVGIVHWRCDIATPRGPNLRIRPTPDQCTAWSHDAGFGPAIPSQILSPYHYGLVGRKPKTVCP